MSEYGVAMVKAAIAIGSSTMIPVFIHSVAYEGSVFSALVWWAICMAVSLAISIQIISGSVQSRLKDDATPLAPFALLMPITYLVFGVIATLAEMALITRPYSIDSIRVAYLSAVISAFELSWEIAVPVSLLLPRYVMNVFKAHSGQAGG
jgi:hypothetical protein